MGRNDKFFLAGKHSRRNALGSENACYWPDLRIEMVRCWFTQGHPVEAPCYSCAVFPTGGEETAPFACPLDLLSGRTGAGSPQPGSPAGVPDPPAVSAQRE